MIHRAALAATVHADHEGRSVDTINVNLVLFGGVHGREAVDFVEEDSRGLGMGRVGFFEEEAELTVRLRRPI